MKKLIVAFKRINKLSPKLLSICIAKNIVISIAPFVSIILLSKIILTFGWDCPYRNILIIVAVFINFVFYFLAKILEEEYIKKSTILNNNEYICVAKSLFETDYINLENSECYSTILKYKGGIEHYYSVFNRLIWVISDLISGIIVSCCSIVILFPMLFSRSNSRASFIESNYFVLLIVILIVFLVAIVFLLSKNLSKSWNEFSVENMKLNNLLTYFMDIVTDYKSGKEIRNFESADFIENYATDKIIEKGTILQKNIARKSAISSAVIAIIGAIIGFGVYIFIGLRGLIGLFNTSSLVLFTGVFMETIKGVMKIATSAGKISGAIKLSDYYEKIISFPKVKKFGNINKLKYDNITIEFKNVSFKYPNSDSYAINNLSMKILSGEKVAIVGKNGSGKSTLIKLMCRLYDPEKGKILINGVDIKDLSMGTCFDLFSIVFQDYSLFSLPICNNVSAEINYDSKKLKNSLYNVQMLEHINCLPCKEKTFIYKNISDKGIEISGGEAQKLSLARALYKESPIMILDEPTSSLDPMAEKDLYEKFNLLTKNKTTIYISHRLSSCVFCDKIIVLSEGCIVESGTHNELLTLSNGQYKELWEAQAKFYS